MSATKENVAGWTPERVEIAAARWREGWSATQISKVLGLSRNAVMGKIHRLGLSARDQPSEPGKRHPKANPLTPRPKDKKRRPKLTVVATAPEERINRQRVWLPLPDTSPVALLDLKSGQCRWPVETLDRAEAAFCGCPTSGTYCAPHHRLGVSAVQPKPTRKSQPQNSRRAA